MAELLIVVVVVVVLLGYAADRARKLRVRARQMSGMNNRLDAAAAKVDKEQQQRRARVMASAELTSVMPAIKRPPLTIPGMAGHGDEPAEQDDEPAEPEAAPEASPAAEAITGAEAGTPADVPDAPGAEPAPASADAVPAGVPAPPAPRLADDTLSMPAGLTADDLPAVPKIQVTTEGTLIMRPVPDQGRASAGEVMPAPDGMTDEPAASQKRADRR
ncbi:MAG: hypothetical protein ACR2MP_08895 [Streptosporangiaceae bacterium]